MGSSISREISKRKNKIKSFNNVTIPVNYTLVKLCSFNISLKHSVNSENKIKQILAYLDDNNKDKQFDILCLQGIYDFTSAYNLCKAVKIYAQNDDKKLYFAPDMEITDESNTSFKSTRDFFTKSLKSSNPSSRFTKSRSKDSKKNKYKNIIISKYPIITTLYAELDDKTNFDNIVGIQTIVGVNIVINKQIISIYNTELCKDIKRANISNDQMRRLELKGLFHVIKQNKKLIESGELDEYIINDIHLIVGTLNIPEMEEGEINPELIDLVQHYHCLDVYRYKHNKNMGYTNQMNERVDYILLSLTNDLYEEGSEIRDQFNKVKTIKDLFDFINKRYKIYFIDHIVRSSYDHIFKTSYPLEAVFMIKHQDKHHPS